MHIPNPVASNNNSNDNVIRNNAIISVVSVTLSQILSNVPFVALYSNVMINNGLNANDVSEW
jgi:Na+/H+ antiporter NhaD/arsenite permease-like protein